MFIHVFSYIIQVNLLKYIIFYTIHRLEKKNSVSSSLYKILNTVNFSIYENCRMYFIQTSDTLNAVYSTVFEEFRYFLNCIYVSCFLYMFYVIKQDICYHMNVCYLL